MLRDTNIQSASNGAKKVLIFSLAYYPHVGGAEIAIKEITDRIHDIEFHMVTMNFGDSVPEEKIGNVIVHRVGNSEIYSKLRAGKGRLYFSKILFAPRAAYAAWKLHKKHRFDGFWAMMSYMLFPIAI